ncbi:uncharacterized protein LOC143899264 isoform X2 [Temnothorax americanus]|uniref:uncharacterized protein LOC143899264 isoform X2 n=1 Tax=Temnothorax americanus TaxID=1964332 RepID=UPI0040684046
MTRVALVVILVLFSISSVSFVDSMMPESLGKFLGTFGPVKQVRIPDLLNQLCNQSQGSGATMQRDACYGCFYRASILPQGYSMLAAMSTCADTYLNNTNYGHCQAYLRNATSMPNTRSPTLIYCSFLECIRQVNKNSLAINVRGARASSREVAWQVEERSLFKLLKVLARKSVCIIKETNVPTTTTTTVRPGSIDPRNPLQ